MIIIITIIIILIIPFQFFPLGFKANDWKKQFKLIYRVDLRTYTQIHTLAWYKGEGWMEPLPSVLDHDNLQYFETILPLVESLWSTQRDEVYF